jgi:hypothetical protein
MDTNQNTNADGNSEAFANGDGIADHYPEEKSQTCAGEYPNAKTARVF